MIKKIDIAGLQLDNYTVREMLMRVDRRISEKILTTIEEVNMDTLALAESGEAGAGGVRLFCHCG